MRTQYFQECSLHCSLQKSKRSIGVKNLLLQAFPTCWQDMMGVYQKVTERPFGYTVLDLHPARDDDDDDATNADADDDDQADSAILNF